MKALGLPEGTCVDLETCDTTLRAGFVDGLADHMVPSNDTRPYIRHAVAHAPGGRTNVPGSCSRPGVHVLWLQVETGGSACTLQGQLVAFKSYALLLERNPERRTEPVPRYQ